MVSQRRAKVASGGHPRPPLWPSRWAPSGGPVASLDLQMQGRL